MARIGILALLIGALLGACPSSSPGVATTGPIGMARRAAGRCAFVVVAALAVAGCAFTPGATDPAAAHQRAQAVLSAWADAVAEAGAHAAVTPVGELTGQVGDWEEAVGDNNKRALMAGLIASEAPLSDEPPPDGEVVWPDGTTTTVPLKSAQHAIVAIGSTTEAPCHDCAVLLVTAAELTSGPIQTTRGPATAPIWEFTVEGTAVRITHVAVANPVVVAPDDGGWGLGLAIDAASGSVEGRELTVAFVGAPNPGNMACGEDYTAEAVESELAVVVIVTRHPRVAVAEACTAVGARRTATATLAAPLGDRVVLDLQQGTPVPIALDP